MQLIFKYDFERLMSYSVNKANNIKVLEAAPYTLLSFPEVGYFNYAFNHNDEPFTEEQLKNIQAFYLQQDIAKHQLIVDAKHKDNGLLLTNSGYAHKATIAKTVLLPNSFSHQQIMPGLAFVPVTQNNLAVFTRLYLNGFGAVNRNADSVLDNFGTLLNKPGISLYVLQHNLDFVGINVLYHHNDESLLAGGAIMPEFRNHGYHKSGLAFRIQQSLALNNSKKIVAWAYDDSISLQNMLKLKMTVQQKFMVYEYCN
ncbi:hypothetical protein FFF34_014105 [Inquilinus sp. KBS0705]|nr:hypothetical protein FFF34_014105 [Inquilinus sp. KBS0705]